MKLAKLAAIAAAMPLLLGLLPGPLAAAEPSASVLLLPFANSSGAGRAQEVVESALAERLEAKRYGVIRGDRVRSFLASERLRYIDSFSAGERRKLFQAFEAGSALLGTIYDFSEGHEPVVGISARMVDPEGRILWSAASGLIGSDTEGALGLRRIGSAEGLAQMAVSRLVANLPSPGKGPASRSGRIHRIGLGSPRTFRSVGLAPGARHRVCLLPLANKSSDRAAARLVGDLLARRMSESPLFDVVEPADFRAAMVKAGVAGLKSGDPVELKKLGDVLGTHLFLTGTIYRYRGASSNAALPPELELELTLTDITGDRILWTAGVARKGSDYAGLFALGEISNIVTLADQVAAEVVHAVETARPRGSAPPAAKAQAAGRPGGSPPGS